MKFSEQSLSLAFDQMVVSAVPFTPALPDSPCRPKVGCKLEGWFQSKLKNFTFCLICCGFATSAVPTHCSPIGPHLGILVPKKKKKKGKARALRVFACAVFNEFACFSQVVKYTLFRSPIGPHFDCQRSPFH